MTVIATKNGLRAVAAKSWPLAGLYTRDTSMWPAGVWGGGVDLIDSPLSRMAYADIYRQQVWVAIVVNKLARGIGRLPLKTYRESDNGDRIRVRNDPLPELFAKPFPRGHAFKWKEFVIGQLGIYGNALLVKYRPRSSAPPTEIWPIPWQNIRVIKGSSQPIDGYEYVGPAGERLFLPEDVVHFQWFSPDFGAGVSPLEPLRRTLALEDAGQRYAASSFRQGARPSGALTTEQKLNKQHKDQLEAAITAATTGPDRAFGMLLLDGGLNWQPFAHTAQEAETIAHRKLNREEVAAAFDMDPTQVRILDRATFSNVTEAHLSLYMDTFGPWLTNLEETIKAQLIDPEPSWADQFCEFDLGEVMRGNPDQRSIMYQRFLQSGIYTPNEMRRFENLPAIDDRGADAIYVPMNLVALDGQIPSRPGTPIGTPALAPSTAEGMASLLPWLETAVASAIRTELAKQNGRH